MSEDLRRFVLPDETALQLFARSYSEPFATGVFFLGTVRAGQIYEVSGPSNSGKTTLLLQVAANAILPVAIDKYTVNGLQERVIFIDLDNKFDVLRLMMILNTRIQAALEALGRDAEGKELDKLMEECLGRFFLIRCGSSRELLTTLKTIRPFICQLQEEGAMRLLLLDNIAAFYWVDAAVRGKPPVPGQAVSALTLQAVHSVCAAELRSLAKQMRLAVIATKHSFRAETAHGDEIQWSWREVMTRPWVDAVSERLLLQHLGGGVGDLASRFGAKWDLPEQRHIHTFAISDAGIMPFEAANAF